MDRASLDRAEIGIDRDEFVRVVLRELTGLLEDVVGYEDTEGFVTVAGRALGTEFDRRYREALDREQFTRDEVAEILVDLKRRINGGFRLEHVDDDVIEMVNDACPFGEHVLDRPALCMMTSNVFGLIASQHLGFATVEIREAIARGHGRCHVLVHLREPAIPVGAPARTYRRTET